MKMRIGQIAQMNFAVRSQELIESKQSTRLGSATFGRTRQVMKLQNRLTEGQKSLFF
jgi:hypothetical protein